MDGNKDEALRCLRIGQNAIDAGDRASALKFINKARRLDPSLSVDDLLSKLEGQSGDNNKTTGSSSAKSPDNDKGNSNVRLRAPAPGPSSSSAVYSEEQISIVREIKRKKDYYEILGVEKACTVEDVRKAYRKLSLRVHPDKNQAPGSEEAFKSVSKAFQCLSNEDSRRKYDVTGSDEPVYERRTTRRAHQGFNGFYDGDVDAEEIFRNFFFGGMQPGAATQFGGFSFGAGTGARRPAENGDGSGGGSNFRALIQLLPVLLILLVNFLPSSQPIYSLSRSHPYNYMLTTQRGVNFYVKSTTKFEEDYPPTGPERVALESRIEREYVSILSYNCQQEMQRLNWGFTREAPHCDMLKQFRTKA